MFTSIISIIFWRFKIVYTTRHILMKKTVLEVYINSGRPSRAVCHTQTLFFSKTSWHIDMKKKTQSCCILLNLFLILIYLHGFSLRLFQFVLDLSWSPCSILFLFMDTVTLFDFQRLYSPKFARQSHSWKFSHCRRPFVTVPCTTLQNPTKPTNQRTAKNVIQRSSLDYHIISHVSSSN